MKRFFLEERRLLRHIDLLYLATLICIILIGLAMIYSARASDGDGLHHVQRQLMGLGIGAVVGAFMLTFDYGALKDYRRLIYIGNLALLVAVLFLGREAMGAQRWLRLGPLPGIQPSELAKLAVVITLAAAIDDIEDLNNPWSILKLLVHIGIPMVLILRQPDLGTSLVFLMIFISMVFVAGLKTSYIGGLTAMGIVAAPLVYFFILHDYQRRRLTIFLDPWQDPQRSGYNVIQSMLAVGSGRLFGKGYLQGTQGQLRFLPERHTDFIFAVFAEEFGFIGALVLLGLFALLIYRGICIIGLARDRFGALLVTGVVSILFFQVLVNVGVTIGVMPATGIPLPFVSYGGSSMMAYAMAIGLTLNVLIRKKKISF